MRSGNIPLVYWLRRKEPTVHVQYLAAKYRAHVLTEIKNRGTKDVCILVFDRLSGLPEAGLGVAPDHRAGVRDASAAQQRPLRQPQGLAGIGKDLKPIYTAPTEAAALDRLAEQCLEPVAAGDASRLVAPGGRRIGRANIWSNGLDRNRFTSEGRLCRRLP
jgi:hypothetical protein